MKLLLTRTDYRASGIFGRLEFSDGTILFTLERAYHQSNDTFRPKLPNGTYECKLGIHRLHDLKSFETFEVMNVPGHTGILFHKGNRNEDSEGCILIGMYRTEHEIYESRIAFNKFMEKLKDVKEFTLEAK